MKALQSAKFASVNSRHLLALSPLMVLILAACGGGTCSTEPTGVGTSCRRSTGSYTARGYATAARHRRLHQHPQGDTGRRRSVLRQLLTSEEHRPYTGRVRFQ